MKVLQELKYSETHEWLQETGEGTVRIGISDFAQSELGDLVFVNLPEIGDEVTAGEVFGDVESVKAVSDLYSPVSGIVCAINEEVSDAPEKLNEDPYGSWLIEVREVSATVQLYDAEAYEGLCHE